MTSEALPTVFGLVHSEPDPALDAALVETLTDLSPATRKAALDLLFQRSHESALLKLVCHYQDFDAELQTEIVRRGGSWSGVLRKAVTSDAIDTRLGAIDIIARGERADLAFLLVSALRTSCPRTQERAATALNSLAAKKSAAVSTSADGQTSQRVDAPTPFIPEALREALASWESHFQPRVLEAVLWWIEETAEVLLAKLGEPKCRFLPIIRGMLRGTCDVRLVGFTLWALSTPELEPLAVEALCGTKDGKWIQAVVDHGKGQVLDWAKARCGASSRRNRLDALLVARTLGLIGDSELADTVRNYTHDDDPTLRSLAVALLSDLPGPETEQSLYAALDDPDARVQANAVEAMDRLSLDGRRDVTEKKLSSPHSRVRANAIKSLLRMEVRSAGVELLKMLEQGSSAERLSALWVVEHLELRSLLGRVVQAGREDPDARVRQRAQRLAVNLKHPFRDAQVSSMSNASLIIPRPEEERQHA